MSRSQTKVFWFVKSRKTWMYKLQGSQNLQSIPGCKTNYCSWFKFWFSHEVANQSALFQSAKAFSLSFLHCLSWHQNCWSLYVRVQRKSVLQLAIRVNCSKHVLAQNSFQLAPKTLWWEELIAQFFCNLYSSKNLYKYLPIPQVKNRTH